MMNYHAWFSKRFVIGEAHVFICKSQYSQGVSFLQPSTVQNLSVSTAHAGSKDAQQTATTGVPNTIKQTWYPTMVLLEALAPINSVCCALRCILIDGGLSNWFSMK